MAASIRHNYIYNVLLNVSKVIFPLITAPYVSRILEPDGVGLFNFANTYANYYALFAALGIPYYGIREVAKIGDNQFEQTKFVSEIISISFLATIICTILFFISLVLVPQLSQNYLYFLIAGIVLYITPFRIDWYYSGKEEFKYITIRSLLIKTLSIILLFVLVKTKEDLIIYVGLNAVSQILNELWNYIKLYRSGIHPYFTLSGIKHLRSLLILFSSAIATSIYTMFSTLLLGFIAGYEEVGYYNSASQVSKALLPIVTSLSTVALARISVLKVKDDWESINKLMNNSLSIVIFLAFPIVCIAVCTSNLTVPLFFGEQFTGSIVPFQIIMFNVIFIGLSNLMGIQILLSLGLDNVFLKAILLGAIVNFTFNILLIPHWGSIGAAFASVLGEAVILWKMIRYVYKFTRIRFTKRKEIMNTAKLVVLFVPILSYFAFNHNYVGVVFASFMCCIFYMIVQFILRNTAMSLLIISFEKYGGKRYK